MLCPFNKTSFAAIHITTNTKKITNDNKNTAAVVPVLTKPLNPKWIQIHTGSFFIY